MSSLTPSRIGKVIKKQGHYLQWLARDKDFRATVKADFEADKSTARGDIWAVYIHLAELFNLPTDVSDEAQTTALVDEPVAKKAKTDEQVGGAAGSDPPCCLKHGTRPIDTWYDCQDCLLEADEWAKANGYTQCVSAHVHREGTDNGEWVAMNADRLQF